MLARCPFVQDRMAFGLRTVAKPASDLNGPAMPHVLHHPHTFHWPSFPHPRLRLADLVGRVVFFFLTALMALLEWPPLLRLERLFGGTGRSLTKALLEAEEE